MRQSILLASAFAAAAQAQTPILGNSNSSSMTTTSAAATTSFASGTTTITGFLGASSVFASIVSVEPCGTTMVIDCMNPSVCRQAQGLPITYVQGPYSIQEYYSGAMNEPNALIREYCSFNGPSGSPTEQICTGSGTAYAGGGSYTTVTSLFTVEGTSIYAPITVTAGMYLLGTGTGGNMSAATCTSTGAVPVSVALAQVPAPTVPAEATCSANCSPSQAGSTQAEPTRSGAVRTTRGRVVNGMLVVGIAVVVGAMGGL